MTAVPLLSVRGLSVQFVDPNARHRTAQALTDLNVDVGHGEVLALLGESGCGKSVTLRTLLRLHAPQRTRVTGSIHVDGHDVLALRGAALQRYRGGVVSMVFQEPGLAFDPVYTIGDQIAQAVRAHERAGPALGRGLEGAARSASDAPVGPPPGRMDRAAARQRALHLLERVQIPQARRRLDAYAHELSGGMRQRAMIALALACGPKLLLADEPTTALDATVQIQILLLLRELQRETGMSVIFVTHDIGAAVEVADRIAVMYAGRIVEENTVAGMLAAPRHPYSAGLLAATVTAAHRGHLLPTIPGAPPDLAALPPGCAFAPRCGAATPQCVERQPALHRDAGAALACWHPVAPPRAPDHGGSTPMAASLQR